MTKGGVRMNKIPLSSNVSATPLVVAGRRYEKYLPLKDILGKIDENE